MIRHAAVLTLLLGVFLPRQAAAIENEQLLALVAMPLAVAAVAEVTDVPASELFDSIALLNAAEVPPVEFVEVVRYLPVALVEDAEFIEALRARQQEGLRGPQFVAVVEQRFSTYGLHPTSGDDLGVVDESYIPPLVRTRVAERRPHPHGGPPGQLKKERGLETGAEVVHGERRVAGKAKGKDKVKKTGKKDK